MSDHAARIDLGEFNGHTACEVPCPVTAGEEVGHREVLDDPLDVLLDESRSATSRKSTGRTVKSLSLQDFTKSWSGRRASMERATWADMDRDLAGPAPCPKLKSYWQFYGCRYDKISRTCAEPDHIDGCPLPAHDLRNGRLNQMAYSLYLFIRDICAGDLVGWIDGRLADADSPGSPTRLGAMRRALVDPLRHVFGISDKVISMALASLLIGAPKSRRRWAEVGATMIAVDTLVHNFLHRTGILARFAADHLYGPGCYQPGGCADILGIVAAAIDASAFNPKFPKVFPRFVQSGVWRYCAESGLNICNGNRIDDSERCDNIYCRLRSTCDRVPLRLG
jgi:hypothetical protein